jgi:L-asparaginase
MKHILLIHTGGTLGMSGRRPNALKPSTFFRTVKKRVPELTQLAHVEFELFSNVDSCEMQPELWVELAKKIHERLNEFDGIVVTHGTDTLADTASALSFLLPNLKKPVVLTGAQRPLGEIRTDAHLNLIDAVTSAIHGPKEVTVCFDSHLYRGNRVRKMSVSEYDAFDSPNFAKLGVLGVEARFEKGLVRPKGSTLMAAMNANVFLLRVHPGLNPDIAMSILPKVHGVVLEAYGAGNFPSENKFHRSLIPFFREAHEQKIPVLLVTQAHRNGVDLSLYESGAEAKKLGAISGGDMTTSAALTKLMHGLAHFSGTELEKYLVKSVAGERA